MTLPVFMILIWKEDSIQDIRGAFPSESAARTAMFDCAQEEYGFKGERDDHSTELSVPGTIFQIEEIFMAEN